MKKLILLMFLALEIIAQQALGQSNGSISGKVLDKLTQQPLPGANVVLEGSNLGVTADTTGTFRLTEIALKTYNITFTAVSYKSETLYNITINAGNENYVNVELEPTAADLSEVVVRSNKRTVRAATLETPLSVQRLTAAK